jgi:carbamoyltransferase
MAYMAKEDSKGQLKGTIGYDNSCRPQILDSDNKKYWTLLKEVKKLTGYGSVLNTSFNIHGDPIACSPEDAIRTFIQTKNKYLCLHDYLIKIP